MSIDHGRLVLLAACLMTLTALAACAAPRAPQVRCDANLRPINPSALEYQQP